jgi:23S rRNA U2552 (ribose-2'-O)-methylase RlmE/FtsJ
MLIPLVLPALLAAGKVIAIAGTVKSAVWSGVRFMQHGFDIKATKEQLRHDVATGKVIARDAAYLLKSMRQLAQAHTAESICEAAAHITAALSHLPQQTHAGLDNSIGLSERITSMLESALTRANIELPGISRADLLAELTRRHLEKVTP